MSHLLSNPIPEDNQRLWQALGAVLWHSGTASAYQTDKHKHRVFPSLRQLLLASGPLEEYQGHWRACQLDLGVFLITDNQGAAWQSAGAGCRLESAHATAASFFVMITLLTLSRYLQAAIYNLHHFTFQKSHYNWFKPHKKWGPTL